MTRPEDRENQDGGGDLLILQGNLVFILVIVSMFRNSWYL